MKKKCLLLTCLLTLFLSTTCYAYEYELTRETDDTGKTRYYIEYSDGSYEEISEETYYEKKYEEDSNFGEDIEEESNSDNNESTIIEQETDSDSSENYTVYDSNIRDIELNYSILTERKKVVFPVDDITEDNFLNAKKITDDDGNTYFYVILRDYLYTEVDETDYYYLTYKFERGVEEASETNENVEKMYDEVGSLTAKGILHEDINGHTIYIKIKKYYAQEEFSYFLNAPDYTLNAELPEGEYYIMSGGVLNDYSYTYPISNPDFVIEDGKTTEIFFTVGSVEMTEEQNNHMKNLKTTLENSESNNVAEEVNEVVDEMTDDAAEEDNLDNEIEEPTDIDVSKEETLKDKILSMISKLLIVGVIGIVAYLYVKRKKEE